MVCPELWKWHNSIYIRSVCVLLLGNLIELLVVDTCFSWDTFIHGAVSKLWQNLSIYEASQINKQTSPKLKEQRWFVPNREKDITVFTLEVCACVVAGKIDWASSSRDASRQPRAALPSLLRSITAQLWEEYEKKVSGFKFSKNEHSRNREGTIVLPTELTTFLIWNGVLYLWFCHNLSKWSDRRGWYKLVT